MGSDMGNSSSSNASDLVNSAVPTAEGTFKVDNINSYGRKHATAKIQVSSESVCIRQKHRQSLYIPLETIKRYGLDGSIFILECGRRAPLGQARYAFRCKQARRLVDCLDQRISARSALLLEQQGRAATLSPSTTTANLTPNSRYRRRRRAQSDQDVSRRAPSSILLSSTSSASVSFASRATFSCRNSVPDLSENYVPFDALPCVDHDEAEPQQFLGRLKEPAETSFDPQLYYVQFKSDSSEAAANNEGLPQGFEVSDNVERQKREPMVQPASSGNEATKTAAPYVYIDHAKTITLTDIANKRLQHQQGRRVEV